MARRPLPLPSSRRGDTGRLGELDDALRARRGSAGRLILGIGAGWNEPEYEAFGLPYDHRAGRFEEAVQVIKPLLRTGHVDFEGRYYRAENCDDL